MTVETEVGVMQSHGPECERPLEVGKGRERNLLIEPLEGGKLLITKNLEPFPRYTKSKCLDLGPDFCVF